MRLGRQRVALAITLTAAASSAFVIFACTSESPRIPDESPLDASADRAKDVVDADALDGALDGDAMRDRDSGVFDPGALTPGPIRTADDWLTLFTSAWQRGVSRKYTRYPGDRLETLLGSGADASGANVKLDAIDVFVAAPRIDGAATRLTFPDESVPFSLQNGRRVYSDAAPLFASLVDAIRARAQPTHVTLRTATYRFAPPTSASQLSAASILLAGLEDVELVGESATDPPELVFTNPYGTGITISECHRVRVSTVNVDYDFSTTLPGVQPPVYRASFYRGFATDAGTLRSAELPATEVPNITSASTFDSDGGAWFNGATRFGRFVVFSNSRPLLVDAGELSSAALRGPNLMPPGQEVVFLRDRSSARPGGTAIATAHAVRVTGAGNEDITVDHVTLFAYPQMGFRVELGRGVMLANNTIRARTNTTPLRFAAGRADGIHVVGTRDVIVENNVVQNQGDDGLNIRAVDIQITAIASDGTATTATTGDSAFVEVGDWFALVTNQFRPIHLVRVASISGADYTLDWGAPYATTSVASLLGAGRGTSANLGTLIGVSKSASRWVLRNNTFALSPARALLVHAPNGLVADNNVRSVDGPGVLAMAENGAFVDGPGPLNVGIFRNTLDTVDYDASNEQIRNGAIAIGSEDDGVDYSGIPGYDTSTIDFPVIQRVVVKNNVIRTAGHMGVLITRSRGTEITGNAIAGVSAVGQVTFSDWNLGPGIPQAIGIRKSSAFYVVP